MTTELYNPDNPTCFMCGDIDDSTNIFSPMLDGGTYFVHQGCAENDPATFVLSHNAFKEGTFTNIYDMTTQARKATKIF